MFFIFFIVGQYLHDFLSKGLCPFKPHFIFCLDTKNEAKKVKAAKNFMAKLSARKACAT